MPIQPDVLQSTALIPLPVLYAPGRVGTAGVFETVNPVTELNTSISVFPELLKYERNDLELARIDLLLASLILNTSYTASEVFGISLPKMGIPISTSGTFTPTIQSTPGIVNVPNNPAPLDFIGVDTQLVNRDSALYEALARTSKIFPDTLRSLASSGTTATIDNTWSTVDQDGDYRTNNDAYYDLRYGKYVRLNTGISASDVLNQNTFKLPDASAILRDNVLAAWIAKVNAALLNVYESATRLYLKSGGTDAREPETYVLTSDNGADRVFSPDPYLPGNRLKLVYNKKSATLRWTSETTPTLSSSPLTGVNWGIPDVSVSNPLSFSGPSSGQTLTVLADLPKIYDPVLGYGKDCFWYRQKSKKINRKKYHYIRKYWANVSGVSASPGVLSGGFSHPSMEPGLWEFSFAIQPVAPVQFFAIPTECSPCTGQVSKSQTCVTPDLGIVFTLNIEGNIVSTTASIIPGRNDVIRFRLSIPQAYSNPNIHIGISGIFANVNLINFTQIDSRKLVYLTASSASLFGFSGWNQECLDRAEDLINDSYRLALSGTVLKPEFRVVHVNSASDIRPFSLPVNYNEGSYICLANSSLVTFNSEVAYTPGTHVVFSDVEHLPVIRRVESIAVNDGVYSATLNSIMGGEDRYGTSWTKGVIGFTGDANLPPRLTVDGDTGIVSGSISSVSDPVSYTSILKVRGAVSGDQPVTFKAFSSASPSPITETPFEWTTDSTERWMNQIQMAHPRLRTTVRDGETNYNTGFRIGKPGDVGSPCLVPSILQYSEGVIIGHYDASRAIPVVRVFQPWMLDAGIYVCQDDWLGELPLDCNLAGELVGCVSLAAGSYVNLPFTNFCSNFAPNPRGSNLAVLTDGPSTYNTVSSAQFVTPWTFSIFNGRVSYAKATGLITPPYASSFTVSTLFSTAVTASLITGAFDNTGREAVALQNGSNITVNWLVSSTIHSLTFSGLSPSMFNPIVMGNAYNGNCVLYYLKSDGLNLYRRDQVTGYAVETLTQVLPFRVNNLVSSARVGLSEVLYGVSLCGKIISLTSTAYPVFS